MKKLMALLLAVLTLLSVVSAADFTDAKELDERYAPAVEEMVKLGVINGFEDGTFRPNGTLTRAQAAKIICTMLVGADKVDAITAAPAGFVDVPAGNWAEKYIDYCAEKQIVAGVGNNKFNPNGELTGAAWGKMLLAAYGHPAEELTGTKWFSNTQKAIREKGLNFQAYVSDSPTSREKACQLAYNFHFEYNVMQKYGYEEMNVSFADGKNMKVLGRAEATKDGVKTIFSADGVEFEIECAGQVVLEYQADTSRLYQLIVDGEPVAMRGTTGTGTGTVLLAAAVKPGKHTFRIIQESEYSTAGSTCTLKGITVKGKVGSVKAAANKQYLIEFIGDSITCGNGVLNYNEKMTTEGRSAWRAYSYMAVELLGNADYIMTAKGSIACTKKLASTRNKDEAFSIHDIFGAWNVYADATRPFPYPRTPDIVVINIGTNDKAPEEGQPDEPFITEYTRLVEQVRKQHGDKTKIVMLYNIMKKQHGPALMEIAEKLGGAAKGYYTLEMQTLTGGGWSREGATGHPSYEDNKVNAPILAQFLKGLLQ